MRWTLLVALSLAACDDTGSHDGARGPCAAGGQVLDDRSCFEVETTEDACWKLVECGVIPLDHENPDGVDWGRCVNRLESYDDDAAATAIACVDLASCDQLTVNDSPANPYEWPDCLEYP